MVNQKVNPLSLNKLTCEIPNHKIQILNFLKNKHNDPLYIKFVSKFLEYVPIDYGANDKIEIFESFAEQAFQFFKNMPPSKRKIEIIADKSEENPAITILLLNSNKPFLVASLVTLLSSLALQPRFILHPVIYCKRDKDGILTNIAEAHEEPSAESLIFIKILGNFDEETLESLQTRLNNTLNLVDSTYNSWHKLLGNLSSFITDIKTNASAYQQRNLPIEETIDFLHWLKSDNFTFLGTAEFDAMTGEFLSEDGSSLIWQDNKSEICNIIKYSGSQEHKDKIVLFGKINRASPVNKNTLLDYVLIKKLDLEGNYQSGMIIFGLYGSAIYYHSTQNIPILRQKLQSVVGRSGFSLNGYNAKRLKIIIESLPREALIQIDEEDLYCMCLHMLSSLMSKKLKLFIRQEWPGSFLNILIFMPKERLTPEVHNAITSYLAQAFASKIISDSVAKIVQNFSHLYVTLEITPESKLDFSLEELEARVDALSTRWSEALCSGLYKALGEYQGGIAFKAYDPIFPTDYRHKFSSKTAIEDLSYLEAASKENKSKFNLLAVTNTDFELKIYSPEQKLAISNILPSIENLGFKALDEQSFAITAAKNIKSCWIYHFFLSTPLPIEENFRTVKENVEDALDKMALGILANDSLSKLVMLSGFNWKQVKLLKALTRYLHQTGFTYGKGYVQLTLIKYYKFTELLIDLFNAKFNPAVTSSVRQTELKKTIAEYLTAVTSSSEDKVLRGMFNLLEAMVRTNYYQEQGNTGSELLSPSSLSPSLRGAEGDKATNNNSLPSSELLTKNYFSFKFNSSKLLELPLPRPYAEIFVYSNDFEGIHLRGGKVARGGIRWSDRGEDYRIEVLGLMKAQMTKNPVIVPVGSKGGFFVRFDADHVNSQEYMARVVDCYKNFLRGLLDLTDNIVNGDIIHPRDIVIYDDPDPYLVVAADKGTATFSDYANSISAEYGYWLGDAFASGGSAGYDHKKMGITAKGAWISVKRHFQEKGIDVQKDSITVVGIGDMSGDVFGNGMLRSNTIKLVAAFNHRHIFIDPHPEPLISFEERKRLFNLPYSNWSDYNADLISKGGGVFARASKFITLSTEIRELLQISATELSPEELIRYILKAKVDLIWNGGIGTYIKASTESHFEVGDKANDNLRCNGKDIRAAVIGEGGNLGVSQKGRIEYSRNGGHINTDFIDNSAGVDCSDHEVNIKIVLNQAVATNKLSLVERNKLLAEMTKEVEELVLMDNYDQTLALTITQLSPTITIELMSQLIKELEESKLLDREVEFLPNDTEFARRSSAKESLTRPELAVLLSYSKRLVYNNLASLELTDKYFETYLFNYFPERMRKQFCLEILSHPLRNEIIRTVITNKIVNQLGGALISTIIRDTDGNISDIVRSFIVTKEIFNLDNLWEQVESLPGTIDNKIKIDMFTELEKIMRRGISWFIRNLEHPIDIVDTLNIYQLTAKHLNKMVATLLAGEAKDKYNDKCDYYKAAGISDELASGIATLDNLISAFDIITLAQETGAADDVVARLYFETANKFSIDWLRKSCEKQMDDSYWNRLSIQSLKDDFYDKQRRLLTRILNRDQSKIDLDYWIARNKKSTAIFTDFIQELKLQESINLNMIILANKKFEIFLRKLI